MNSKYFLYLLDRQFVTVEQMAKELGIKKDSLYRKLSGTNGFSLRDVKIILATLDMTFEEVFLIE